MRSSSSLPLWPNACIGRHSRNKKARRSGPFTSNARQRDQDAAGRIVEERGADRALPPARSEGSVLVMAEHDEIDTARLGEAADLLGRLADREMPGGVETALAQRADALVEHALRALFFFFQQLLGHEALGEEQARRHAGDGEQMRLRAEKARQVGGFQKGALALD